MTAGRPVWVTGAAGFLGRAVCRRLLAEGYAVRPVVRTEAAPLVGSGTDSAHAGATVEPAGEPARPREAAESLQPAALVHDLAAAAPEVPAGEPAPFAIVHFAAGIPSPDQADPELVAERNRRIDSHVFDLAGRAGAAVVFASSGSVYGEGHGQSFVEDGPTAPQSPYARAKLRSEAEGAERLAAAGKRFVALRISAPYGPGLRAPTVARIFLQRALQGEDLSYHGSGSRMQDFVYVDDVAEAALDGLRAGRSGVFNVASGEPVTMKELAELVTELVAPEVRVVGSGQPDPQEGQTARYSIDAARRVLGWAPATALRRGLQLWRDRLAQASP